MGPRDQAWAGSRWARMLTWSCRMSVSASCASSTLVRTSRTVSFPAVMSRAFFGTGDAHERGSAGAASCPSPRTRPPACKGLRRTVVHDGHHGAVDLDVLGVAVHVEEPEEALDGAEEEGALDLVHRR
eukprot:CAMPEP_0181334514 /NCGR_PEP_ID=MMETSP1101-20121128/26305_1 /TAXON_ID=46948 /ORGANISM="Rhodomonas abbreviata, Strain Caron Lab Isolate" /LENGTH=127 /DNA_ID=CAMNT_0023444505 /DNA_START=519 /DNA_END=900 /DNA_ORIENTATION=-